MRTHLGRLLVMFLMALGSLAFWDHAALWPVKLLVVMIHETGHAVATLLAGGSVARITIAADQSGQCLSMLPSGILARIAVYSAGYVGSALVSALLLLLTFRFRARRFVLVAAWIWLWAMGLGYAGDQFTFVYCGAVGLAMAVGARYLPDELVALVNTFIATFAVVYVLVDLRDDLWNGEVRALSDAQLLANLTPLPSLVWAALWTVASLGVIAWAIRVSLRAPAKKKRGTLAVPLPNRHRA